MFEVLQQKGFWRALTRNRALMKIAWKELRNSCSKRHFLQEASELVEGLTPESLSLSKHVGIRPQLLRSNGELVEDLVIERTTRWSDCVEALRYLLTPAQLVQGAKIKEYEDAFARTVGVKYAISFSSARVGLYGLLRALGVGEGAEVLLSVPTHIVVANAIRYTGARPVYVDCRMVEHHSDLRDDE